MRRTVGWVCVFNALIAELVLCVLTMGRLSPIEHGYFIDGDKQVVVTHGGLANAETMLAWSYAFADQGYAVSVINLPNHGDWYEQPTSSAGAKEVWRKEALSSKPVIGIGHSLGTLMIRDSSIPLRLLIGTYIGKESKQQRKYRGSLFPSKLLDHVWEPWNPILIEKVLRDTGHPLSSVQKAKIWGYCLLPWCVFVFALVACRTIRFVTTVDSSTSK